MSTGSVSKNNTINCGVYNVNICKSFKIYRCQMYDKIYGTVLLQSSYILCEVVEYQFKYNKLRNYIVIPWATTKNNDKEV